MSNLGEQLVSATWVSNLNKTPNAKHQTPTIRSADDARALGDVITGIVSAAGKGQCNVVDQFLRRLPSTHDEDNIQGLHSAVQCAMQKKTC
mmetsp:Transcript_16613/g.26947  ORF Transcript_16613/g.26947 Transcript_16613/m.26947 type:complete len:91 (+) Transcript_16613:62-334(+)